MSSANYRTVLISATVTLGMAVVHSNTWNLKLRRHVNHMWQSLYAESPDRLGLLPVDDDELWQLTVVYTVTTDTMGPARVDICKRAGRVCIRYVDRPVANGAPTYLLTYLPLLLPPLYVSLAEGTKQSRRRFTTAGVEMLTLSSDLWVGNLAARGNGQNPPGT